MNARILALILVGGSLVVGCGGAKRPPPRATAAAAASAAKHAAPAAETKPASTEPEWVYSAAGKRDPFRSFLVEISRENGFATKCSTKLGRFGIEQYKLVAVVTGLEDPVAMVEAPTGEGFPLRRGACIGRNGGVVAAVRSGEVVVTEWVIRADGTRDPTQTVLSLPKQQQIPEE